jgi:hypothetical protein
MCSISMLPVLKFSLSLTSGFVHKLPTAENIIFLVMENVFHSSLDGTIILYTILACFVTNVKLGELLEFLHSASLSI